MDGPIVGDGLGDLEDFLSHYGVKGMKWGVRNADRPAVKQGSVDLPDTVTSRGEKLSIVGGKTPALARILGRLSSSVRKRIETGDSYTLKNSKGEAVGVLNVYKKAADELNVSWIDVEEEYRGRGYATAAMKATISSAKRQKLKKVTLEVPGNSPDARHIYEKLGFKEDPGQKPEYGDAIWGGLTNMTLELDKKAAHDGMSPTESFLAHYGVKGMKWGVRRNTTTAVEVATPAGRRVQTRGGTGQKAADDAVKAAKLRQKARSSTTDSLSNAELQALVQRMNLEKQYDTLRPRKPSEQAKKFIAETLLGIGKEQAKGYARDYVTSAIKNKS